MAVPYVRSWVRVVCRVPFFFNRPADRRDLHSFPTRRSSDLDWACRHSLWVPSPPRHATRTPSSDFRARWRDGRSEEHTSELQSPMYLVCRLLLEKKKKPGKSNLLVGFLTIRHQVHSAPR